MKNSFAKFHCCCQARQLHLTPFAQSSPRRAHDSEKPVTQAGWSSAPPACTELLPELFLFRSLRRKRNTCRKSANRTSDPRSKAAPIAMALAWRRLADQAEFLSQPSLYPPRPDFRTDADLSSRSRWGSSMPQEVVSTMWMPRMRWGSERRWSSKPVRLPD
jgi:hypothetical protein